MLQPMLGFWSGLTGLPAKTASMAASEADVKQFVCNAMTIGRAVVIQAGGSSQLQKQLTRRRFEFYPVDLSEFLKAGGSAKCLVLRLQ